MSAGATTCSPCSRERDVERKLVRDRIPELIAADGRLAKTEVLEGANYTEALVDKLAEEAAELATELGVPTPDASRVVAELADVVEVVRAIAAASGSDLDAVMDAADRKRAERGGFQDRIRLLGISRPPTCTEPAE